MGRGGRGHIVVVGQGDRHLDAATTDHDKIEVLEMLYDQASRRLAILVKVNKNTLKSVVIELSSMSVEMQGKMASHGKKADNKKKAS